MPTATDGVSRPPHQREYHADDEKNMGEDESGDKARENEPQYDKDNSEDDHDVYLDSLWMFGKTIAGVSVLRPHLGWTRPGLGLASG